MDADAWITLIWFVTGLALVGAEFLLPGMVSVFLGASALLVALLRELGLVSGLPASLALWMVTSVGLVLGLRGTVRRYFKPEESVGDIDESRAAFGSEVEVIETCREDEGGPPAGRIRFQGSSWPAVSTQGTLHPGERARLVYRDNLTWVVEPVERTALPASLDEGGAGVVPVAQRARASSPEG